MSSPLSHLLGYSKPSGKKPQIFHLAHFFFMLMLAELGNYLNSPPTTTGC
jgi:hypothetical protein